MDNFSLLEIDFVQSILFEILQNKSNVDTMNPKELHEKLKTSRVIYLANAEAILSMAEREIGKGADHACFHLALLAMEEIGKSILATINYMNITAHPEKEELVGAMDDHAKKLFWAIWGGSMLRNTKFTKESIEQTRNLATNLHERRLETLYTDAKNPLPVTDRVEEKEVRMITEFTRARLELEKTTELTPFEEGDVEEITWFFSAVEDIEHRKEIFGSASLNKLAELGNGKEWIKWLREVYRKHKIEMRDYAQKEMQRQKPEGEEAFAPKYRMRIRIQTPSHSIRNSAFVHWNKEIDNIKVYQSNRKNIDKLTKGELLIDLTLPKGLHTSYVWEHGFFMAKTVVLAFNIGTLGVFWWNVPKDISRYYEDIVDLEADPKGGVKLFVEPHKRLNVGFDEARLVLDQKAIENVYHIFALFMRESKMLEEFLKEYAMGLTFFSKIDIHLRLEANAFESFYKALKGAARSFGAWDGKSDFKQAIKKEFEKIGDMKDLEKTLDLAMALEDDTTRDKPHPITLTEVITIKVYCDYYIQQKAKEYFAELDTKKQPQPIEPKP